ncbi:MAG: mechanosensitive ion channel family protein, partial [Chloroflexi bacterium]|nr:mechanosensitive ion channel family protein [Chloroflexota bacterium]
GQYCVGDVAKVADISGLVIDINLRRTVLRDLDGIVHFVPNGEIKVASNFTKGYSGININIGVSYSANLDKAMATINEVGKSIAADPAWKDSIIKAPYALRVDELGDSSIAIKIAGETRPMKQWDVMGELRKRLKEAFDREGIEIPYPHMKVYFGDPPLNIQMRKTAPDNGETEAKFQTKTPGG